MKKILETQRIILKIIEEDKFEELANLLANENVHKFFPKVLNRQESLEFFEENCKRQSEDGISFWAVVRKNDFRFLGLCGLLKQIIDEKEEIEVGYRINDQYWGKGYGTEAAKGCIAYANNNLRLSSVISLIIHENKQSIRVAVKNGLKLEKNTIFHGRLHQVYRIKF